MNRAPRASTMTAERGATRTIANAAGMIANPAWNVVYWRTFWRYCWPMNIAPMSEPKTMMPAQAATQNVGRAAMSRSYNGFVARRWRMTNATAAATAMRARPTTSVPMFGTGAKLIARINVPTSSADRMPPRLSTGSTVSLTWAGTNLHAMYSARTASGSVTRKTDPQSNDSSRKPDTSGPSAAIAPPRADQRAMACVRAGPGAQRAVISASVVG